MTGDRPGADRPSADRPSADRPSADRPSADRPSADRPHPTFHDPAAAVAGGRVLVPAGVVVAVALALHPLPQQGLEESAGVLAATPLWGPIHVAIAFGFVGIALGAVVVLASGGPGPGALDRFAWAAAFVGILFFAGVALVNAWVLDPLARDVAAGGDRAIFDTMNRLLVGFGWLGNPLFLLGLTVIAGLESAIGGSTCRPGWRGPG